MLCILNRIMHVHNFAKLTKRMNFHIPVFVYKFFKSWIYIEIYATGILCNPSSQSSMSERSHYRVHLPAYSSEASH